MVVFLGFAHNLNNNKVDASTEWQAALLEKTGKNNYITIRKQEQRVKLKRADTDIIDIISRFCLTKVADANITSTKYLNVVKDHDKQD